jgi:hypothetical protein
MSRKTPKSKSATATASAPKAKAKPKPVKSVKPKASSSGGSGSKKRSTSNISIEALAERVAALESGNSAFQHDLRVLMVEINLISEWIKDKFGKTEIMITITIEFIGQWSVS